MKGIDPVWKDRMQAEIEGYFGPHRNDDVETKELVEKAGNSARLTEQQVEFHTHHLVSHGFTRLKHFKGLRKPSFYHICSSVLMAQELRKEVKKRLGEKPPETLVEGMTGLSIGTFKLPIVGSLQAKELLAGAQVASVTAHTTFEVSQTTMDRVIRQIDGKIYEYDRLCPHKKADLSQVCAAPI